MNKTELEQMFEEYDFTEKQKALLSSIIKKTGATEVKVTPGTRGCRLPQGWKPSQETKSWTLLQEITKEEANQEYFKFKDYWQSKSGKDACKVDWEATWRNWIRNYVQMRGSRTQGQSRKFERHAGEPITA